MKNQNVYSNKELNLLWRNKMGIINEISDLFSKLKKINSSSTF